MYQINLSGIELERNIWEAIHHVLNAPPETIPATYHQAVATFQTLLNQIFDGERRGA